MKWGLLVNPSSQRHQRDPGLADKLGRALGAVHVAVSSTVDDVPARAAELRRLGVEAVAISGGDGTMHNGISAVCAEWQGALPAFGLIPAGTMNTIVRGLGGGGRPDRIAASLRDGRTRHESRTVIDAGDGRLGFLVGTGFWARFLEAYDQASGPGPIRAAAVLGRGLVSTAVGGRFVRDLFEPVRGRVTWDGEVLDHDSFTMVAAGAVDQVGLGFAPFLGIGANPGQFHGLAFTTRPARVATQLPALFRGHPPKQPDTGGRVASLTLESETPFLWAIDGELQPLTTRLCCTAGPELDLMLPV